MGIEIVVDIGHAHLFIAAQKRTEGVARRDTALDEVGAGIEGEHSRTLIVNDAATEQPAFPALHAERIGGPTGSRGHDVHVRDGRHLGSLRARDVGHAHIAVIIRRAVAETLGHGERTVERLAHRAAERGARLGSGGVGDRGDLDQTGYIRDDVLPDLIDVGLDVADELVIHISAPNWTIGHIV